MKDLKLTWTCIRCEVSMANMMDVIQPDCGTVFLGSPGYGSTLDMDHVELDKVSEYAIALCDECLKNERDKVKGIKLLPKPSWFERASVVDLEQDREALIKRVYKKG